MHNILIDSEFQALIPPLSAEERAQLEANIVADGCRDPLVVWASLTFDIRLDGGATQTLRYEDGRYQHAIDEHIGPTTVWDLDDDADDDRIDEYGDTITLDQWPHILIDGHNRYEICTRLGLPFEVVVQEFEGREDVIVWMIDNQDGRRNQSSFVRVEMQLKKKAAIERKAKARQQGGQGGVLLPANSPEAKSIETREEIAVAAKVGSNTVSVVERILEAKPEPEILSAVRTGEVSINLAAQFVALPEEARKEAEEAIAQSEPAKEVMREAVHNHRAQGTGENEWYTPQTHLDAAYEVLGGIDLDPASSEIANKTVQADRIFTINDDGLTKEWAGRVWMNPPYAQPFIAQFVEKLASEYEAGHVTEAIALTHNYTDTQWFHRAANACAAICFTRGRIGFLSPEGKRAAPTQGQAFFYFGDKVDAFINAFCRIGFVVEVRNA